MARFFIDRPVFAMVIAIIIVLLGAVAIPNLPIASYPEVVPPQVTVTANYLGGSAQDLEKTVAQPIEEQLVGLDGLLYYASSSANNGVMTITLTFKLGTNPDIAAVQTQDRVSIALPRLPPEVQQQGVVVKKVSTAFLMAVILVSKDDRYDTGFLTNYAQLHLVNQLGSLPGVGESRLGSTLVYSMRIWVNPDKMTKLGVTATDIRDAIAAQNKQNPAGQVGIAPAPPGTDFQYTVNAPGRLADPEEFGNIVIRALPDASLLRIKDVARVELGSQTYNGFSRLAGRPSGNVFLFLSPGQNAVAAADQVRNQMKIIGASLPAGIEYQIPYDSTMFVRAAIADVAQTLLEAVGLVLLVVFIFLQNWRATLIPLLTVPVAVVGTFAVFPLMGFSINITTMFGLVLAIGIVVDDAIVVVEAVQRHIDDGMTPREATIQAMSEVSAPVIAIAFILAAVFIPVAFLGGLSGQIYRQFALTIAFSVLLSAFNALSLSPALSAILLKPHAESKSLLQMAFGRFNHAFEWTTNRYLGGVRVLIRRSVLALAGLSVFWLSAGALFNKLPNGFLPEEDQGAFFVSVRLPDGASLQRADAASRKIEKIVLGLPGVDRYFVNGGTDNATGTQGSNVATIIAQLKPFEERTSKDEQLGPIMRVAQKRFASVPEAFTFPFGLPPILGLATTGGFQFVLEDQSGGDIEALARTADDFLKAARARKELTNVISNFRPDVPAYKLNMDLDKLQTMGVPVAEAYNGLQTFLGGLYVNDFNLYGHTWQVIVQAEPEFRDERADVDRYYVRSSTTGAMVPLSTVASITPTAGPEVIFRYNRFRAVTIIGSPAPGYSSGEAVKVMEDLAAKNLPTGYGYEWTGTTYQQKQAEGHEGFIFGFACLLVFLFLAALYESWSVPFAVLFALPLGIFGALLAVYLRGYPYDIYTQIGIVTLIGLSAKNAILIVEFARTSHEEHGMSILESAMEAARLRLRPILMTSFAFILGVLPLFLATGASSASRRSLGTAVFGGMLAATLLAVLIVPVLYVVVENFVERGSKKDKDNGHAETVRTRGGTGAMKKFCAILFALATAGCTLGPNYKRPALALPDQFHGASAPAAGASLADTKWVDLFQDDVLRQLVNTALEHNFDVRIAAEHVLEARAQLGITRANQFPLSNGQVGFATQGSSTLGGNPHFEPPIGTNLNVSYTSALGNVTWDADLWGRLRRLTEAARAQYLASDEGRRAVIVSLVGDVMDAYFSLIEQDLELAIGNGTREVANNGLRLTQVRHDRGAASSLDIYQAQQLLFTATSQIASTQRQIGETEDALSLLTGAAPHDIVRTAKLEQIPLPPELPAGLPSALLTRRPDIRAAEENLIAANAQIGAVRATYFPDISLTAFFGAQSRDLTALMTTPAREFSVAPATLFPIFRAGQIRAAVHLTEAQQREALIDYQKTVYSALRDVSDALINHDRTREQRTEEEKLVGALTETVRVATMRYQGGLDSYLQVLDAQRDLFQGQLTLAELRLQELLSVVQLYRALGGGWQ